MSDLQIGLLVIGAAAVAGVLIYNRVQERATRRRAEAAFASRHADVLLEQPDARREPTFEAPAPAETPPPRPPGPWTDYVVELRGAGPGALRREWPELERRFAARVALREAGPTTSHIALQMVSRNGVVSEAELREFCDQVERMAAAHGAAMSAAPVDEALRAARALDQVCADVDVQIALHVLGAAQAATHGEGFSVTKRADGVTLLLDVPRTPDLPGSYAAMVAAARSLGGRVVDDNGNALDARALDAIGAQVEALRARMAEIGIQPGSPLAQRLFS